MSGIVEELFTRNMRINMRIMQRDIHENAKAHGWWEDRRSDGECVALMHSELSEALEAMRNGCPGSVKIPGHPQVAEELADCVIRIMDYCEAVGLDLGAAIVAKHEHNKGRPYRHGGKAF